MTKPKIIIPNSEGHTNDTFRELVKLWENEGLCTIEYKRVSNVWFNEVNDVLLYDRPTMQWFHPVRDKYKKALFGNPDPKLPNSSSWIFWGRRPLLIENVRKEGIKSLKDRTIESIFLGKIENNIQQKNRTQYDWSTEIELFEMPIRGEYKYSQKEYLNKVNDSKYGLCLEGFGGKCNREIELFSLGTIPIITNGVNLSYYNELVEGTHYLKVDKPSDIKPLLSSITDEKWNEMSKNCLKWYEENCSVKGSFDTTIKIINEI
jgi:hypothetical protein